MQQHLSQFEAIVGKDYVRTNPQDLTSFGKDWTRGYEAKPSCVVLPRTTQEVSKLLAYCNQNKLSVVPSGGRTGLAAAAYATNGEVVIALDRMNKVLKVDGVGLTMEVEAGVTTQTVLDTASSHGLFFGLNLASKGSCQIGGNIATNAGGTKLIRYGGMREQLLGVEVVLANGEVIDMNTSLRKNNTGYDLKQLFIGSEGTLGIVTKATVKLMPPPKDFRLVCMSVSEFSHIPAVLKQCNLQGMQLTAFEFFSDLGLKLVLTYHPSLRAPFSEKAAYYMLIEQENMGDADAQFEKLCEVAFENGWINDAIVAESSAQFHALWGLRENISESISHYGHVRKNDISLPIDQLDAFVQEIDEIVTKAPKEVELVLFGHIGDGNLHINYIAPKELDAATFKSIAVKVEKEIFSRLPKYKGSISAEHGIGLSKKSDLHLCRTEVEVGIMRAIKKQLDPNGIMNPGKIFDL